MVIHAGDDLTARQKQILSLVVEAYINQGEPVGSKYICDSGSLSCSSATVRNEMAELELKGYLEQPHTSAGRIPTELGYRFYVDCLLSSYNSTASDVEKIKRELKAKRAELDGIIEQASRLASSLTNYTGVMLRSGARDGVFSKFDTVYIGPRSFLLVMIAENGTPASRHICTDFTVTKEETELLGDVLTRTMAGLPANEITLPVIMQAEELCGNSRLVNLAVKTIYESASEGGTGDLRLSGVNKLLSYPEYSSAESLEGVLGLRENKKDILQLLNNSGDDGEGVKIFIGSENGVDALGNSALVFKSVTRGGKVIGAVGVIGPRRMEYSRVISMVDSLASGINELIAGGNMLPEGDIGERKREEE